MATDNLTICRARSTTVSCFPTGSTMGAGAFGDLRAYASTVAQPETRKFARVWGDGSHGPSPGAQAFWRRWLGTEMLSNVANDAFVERAVRALACVRDDSFAEHGKNQPVRVEALLHPWCTTILLTREVEFPEPCRKMEEVAATLNAQDPWVSFEDRRFDGLDAIAEGALTSVLQRSGGQRSDVGAARSFTITTAVSGHASGGLAVADNDENHRALHALCCSDGPPRPSASALQRVDGGGELVTSTEDVVYQTATGLTVIRMTEINEMPRRIDRRTGATHRLHAHRIAQALAIHVLTDKHHESEANNVGRFLTNSARKAVWTFRTRDAACGEQTLDLLRLWKTTDADGTPIALDKTTLQGDSRDDRQKSP